MSHIHQGPLATYNSLTDKHLSGYYGNSRIRRHLVRSGLINKRGQLITENQYRINMARKEHKKHVKDLLAQAIVHKTLDMERYRQVEIRKKLEEIAKIEMVRRVRADRHQKHGDHLLPLLSPKSRQAKAVDSIKKKPGLYDEMDNFEMSDNLRPSSVLDNAGMRGRKGDEEVLPYLSPTSSRPMSERPREKISLKYRPQSAPGLARNGYVKPHDDTILVDEDGRPVTPPPLSEREVERKIRKDQIDSRHLYALDSTSLQKYAHVLSRHERGGAVSPYLIAPIPTPPQSSRIHSTRRRTKMVASPHPPKEKKIKPVKGSLMLHRHEPAMMHQGEVQSFCEITMKYHGPNLTLPRDQNDPTQDVSIDQQHCGGNTLQVFRKRLEPGSIFTFLSRRHRGYPFSLTIYIDGRTDCRVSTCCEYKHAKGIKLGGKMGHFTLVEVAGDTPCYKCQLSSQAQPKKRLPVRKAETIEQEVTVDGKKRTPVVTSKEDVSDKVEEYEEEKEREEKEEEKVEKEENVVIPVEDELEVKGDNSDAEPPKQEENIEIEDYSRHTSQSETKADKFDENDEDEEYGSDFEKDEEEEPKYEDSFDSDDEKEDKQDIKGYEDDKPLENVEVLEEESSDEDVHRVIEGFSDDDEGLPHPDSKIKVAVDVYHNAKDTKQTTSDRPRPSLSPSSSSSSSSDESTPRKSPPPQKVIPVEAEVREIKPKQKEQTSRPIMEVANVEKNYKKWDETPRTDRSTTTTTSTTSSSITTDSETDEQEIKAVGTLPPVSESPERRKRQPSTSGSSSSSSSSSSESETEVEEEKKKINEEASVDIQKKTVDSSTASFSTTATSESEKEPEKGQGFVSMSPIPEEKKNKGYASTTTTSTTTTTSSETSSSESETEKEDEKKEENLVRRSPPKSSSSSSSSESETEAETEREEKPSSEKKRILPVGNAASSSGTSTSGNTTTSNTETETTTETEDENRKVEPSKSRLSPTLEERKRSGSESSSSDSETETTETETTETEDDKKKKFQLVKPRLSPTPEERKRSGSESSSSDSETETTETETTETEDDKKKKFEPVKPRLSPTPEERKRSGSESSSSDSETETTETETTETEDDKKKKFEPVKPRLSPTPEERKRSGSESSSSDSETETTETETTETEDDKKKTFEPVKPRLSPTPEERKRSGSESSSSDSETETTETETTETEDDKKKKFEPVKPRLSPTPEERKRSGSESSSSDSETETTETETTETEDDKKKKFEPVKPRLSPTPEERKRSGNESSSSDSETETTETETTETEDDKKKKFEPVKPRLSPTPEERKRSGSESSSSDSSSDSTGATTSEAETTESETSETEGDKKKKSLQVKPRLSPTPEEKSKYTSTSSTESETETTTETETEDEKKRKLQSAKPRLSPTPEEKNKSHGSSSSESESETETVTETDTDRKKRWPAPVTGQEPPNPVANEVSKAKKSSSSGSEDSSEDTSSSDSDSDTETTSERDVKKKPVSGQDPNSVVKGVSSGKSQLVTGSIMPLLLKQGSNVNLNSILLSSEQVAELANYISEEGELHSLVVHNAGLSDDSFQRIVLGLKVSACKPELLNFTKNNLGEASMPDLIEILRTKPSVKTVLLHGNPLGDDGCKKLADGMIADTSTRGRPTLSQTLTKEEMWIEPSGYVTPSEERAKQASKRKGSGIKLKTLDLGKTGMTDLGIEAIANMLEKDGGVEALNLNQNTAISLAGWSRLGRALETNSTLKKLSLNKNPVGDDGIQKIADGLRQNTTLTSLELEHVDMSDKGGKALQSLLTENSTICTLTINPGNTVSESVQNGIKKYLALNIARN